MPASRLFDIQEAFLKRLQQKSSRKRQKHQYFRRYRLFRRKLISEEMGQDFLTEAMQVHTSISPEAALFELELREISEA